MSTFLNSGNRDVYWRNGMTHNENYRCVAPGKTQQFLKFQYMKVIDENCPLQARPSTLCGMVIITMWRRFIAEQILTTAG